MPLVDSSNGGSRSSSSGDDDDKDHEMCSILVSRTCSQNSLNAVAENTSVDVADEPRLLPEVFSLEDWASTERLGFSLSSNLELRHEEVAAMPFLQDVASRCERHWHSFPGGLPLLTNLTTEVREFMRRSVWRHGVPRHLRGMVWLTLSGVALKMDENKGFCRALLERHGYMRGEYAEAIEKDLLRTFPGHRYFSPDGVGTIKLRNVLHALCWRNPLLNYCQSFNYLAAFLLLVLDDEESTFWFMCHLLEHLLPNDLYSESLVGTRVDQLVLVALVEERLPRLAQHFVDIHFDVGTLVPAWLMVLFVNVFPVETVLRVWDCLLAGSSCESSSSSCVPLEVVLATLKLFQAQILQCIDAGDLVTCLSHITKRLFEAEKLARLIRKKRLALLTLQQMRQRMRPIVLEEHRQRERRRRELSEKHQMPRKATASVSQAAVQKTEGQDKEEGASLPPKSALGL